VKDAGSMWHSECRWDGYWI